jgi:hypothetical protein
MRVGFLLAAHAKMRGDVGVGRRAPAQLIQERQWQLMDARLAEYAAESSHG